LASCCARRQCFEHIARGKAPLSDQGKQVAWNVVRFVALTFVVSALFASIIIRTGSMSTGRWLYVRGAMWSPAIAVALVRPMRDRPFGGIGWQWRGGYQVAAYGAAIGASIVAYGIAWMTGLARFPNDAVVGVIARDFGWVGLPVAVVVPAYIMITATLGLLPALPSALGEEIGWRGYLVPELSRVCSFTTTSFLSGAIWTMWHVPMILFADFAHGAPRWYGLACFSIFIMAASFICAWLRLKSGSVWPTVVLHATSNLMLQDVLTPLTIQTPVSRFFVDEFGCLLPVLAIVGAIFCWRRRAEVEVVDATSDQNLTRSPVISVRPGNTVILSGSSR
jgi:membrane protease YdiL (CAAX protease family)